MFPLQHVLSSGFVVVAYAMAFQATPTEALTWLLISSAVTVAVDLDHIVIQLLDPIHRGRAIHLLKTPRIWLDISEAREVLHYPGFGIKRLYVHYGELLIISFAAVSSGSIYAVPVLASLLTHVSCDFAQTLTNPMHR